MKERKYKEDYVLKTVVDSRGRERREAVYCGEWFGFSAAARKKHALCAGGFAAAFALLYGLYLEGNTPSTRCLYVFPLAACALPPFLYWLMGLWTFSRSPEKMTRLQKENGIGRVVRSSLGCAVLLGAACAGDIIYLLNASSEGRELEWLGFVWLALAATVAAGCFVRMREAYRSAASLGKEQGEMEQ